MASSLQAQDSGTSSAVTVTTVMGKNFSVERYYMLSEIEQHALRPVYLDDYYCPDAESTEGETVATVTSDADHYQCDLPPFIILYLLWNCNNNNNNINDSTSSSGTAEEEAEAFQRGPLEKALRKLESLSERIDRCREKEDEDVSTKESEGRLPLQNVYVVVDALLWSDNYSSCDNPEEGSGDRGRKDRFQRHRSIVEALARRILSANETKDDDETMRIRLAGATVGLADHARAAPGLESCLEAILVGVRDRRRHGSNSSSKSCVGIVCDSLQELVGFDEETETDAVQGVMQSLTHASFASQQPSSGTTNSESNNGTNGQQQSPVLDYAHKAHVHWRVHIAGLPPEPTLEEKKAYEKDGLDSKSSSSSNNMWVLALLVLFAAYSWKQK